MRNVAVIAIFAALQLAIVARAAVCRPSLAPRASGPQLSDTGFDPIVADPLYRSGEGPLVAIDEAHNNFHTLEGRYATFATVLRKDGFRFESSSTPFERGVLQDVDVLVIANALDERNARGPWRLPTYPAFSTDEIDFLRSWVEGGGALLIIADHMPFPGAAADLARRFGVYMTNSFATDATCGADEFLFQRSDNTLRDHPITRGRNPSESIDFVRSFTGQAFRVVGGDPLLVLPDDSVVLLPVEAWRFSTATPLIAGDGLAQGAVTTAGKGRVAVFGEAAMFSAQVSGPERRPMGLNSAGASRNTQFLLNVMHWLAGVLPE